MTGATLLGGLVVAVSLANAEGTPAQPVQLTVQIGTTQWLEPGAGSIHRFSVANPMIASVQGIGSDRLSVQGLAVGKTLVVMWTDTGRLILLVRVEAAPEEARSAPSRYRGPPAAKPGQTLYIYQGQVRGRGGKQEGDLQYTGQHHALTAMVPALAGTASSYAALYHAPDQPGRITQVHLQYTDPLFTFELGDLGISSLSVLGASPIVRGGLGSYHDGNYSVLLFGGITPEQIGNVYHLRGRPQMGIQTELVAADNLSFRLQAVRSDTNATLGPRTTVTPSVHWEPLSLVALDVEGAMHESGRAARARLTYDAPVISVHTLYQAIGSSFYGSGSERSDMAQIAAILTPSAYYRLSAVGGYGASGAHLLSRDAEATSRMFDAELAFVPSGLANGAVFELMYAEGRDNQDFVRSPTERSRQRRQLRAAMKDQFSFGGSYRLEASGEEDSQTQSTRATGEETRVQQRSLGSNAQIFLPLIGSALSSSTLIGYERRSQRYLAPAASETEYNYFHVTQGLFVNFYPVTMSLEAMLGYQQTNVDPTTSWGARATLALRPNAAHELRAQATVTGAPWDGGWSSFGSGAPVAQYYTGMLSYTYAFGSAVDAPPMFGLFGDASVDVNVFLDTNEDGEQGEDEHGVENIAVVFDGAERYESDDRGKAHASRLQAGEHSIRVDLAGMAGYRFTTASTRRFHLGRDGHKTINVGISDSGQVFGTIFNDANLDGEYQPGEPGVDGVAVAIGTDESGLKETATRGGVFGFRGLVPGEYIIGIDPRSFPLNYVWGGHNGDPKEKGKWYSGNGHKAGNGYGNRNGGRNGKNGRNGNGSSGGGHIVGVYKIVQIGVEHGEISVVRIPLKALRSIEGRIYVDRDRDKSFTSRDEPVPGVTVRIGNRQATTDGEGRYLFRDLPAGDNTVLADPLTLPRGRVLVQDKVVRQLSVGPTSETVDFLLSVAF